jgi:hypothetical protein
MANSDSIAIQPGREAMSDVLVLRMISPLFRNR